MRTENLMRFYFSGETGANFQPDDNMKNKIKNSIVKYLENYGRDLEQYSFEFRADDGFSLVALDAVLSFIHKHPVKCRFKFRTVFAKDFWSLPDDIQNHYKQAIVDLENKGFNVLNQLEHFVINKSDEKESIATRKLNYLLETDSGHRCTFISYFEKNSTNKWLQREYNYDYIHITRINLCEVLSEEHGYLHSEYVGVRRQKNSGKYYYRIKTKLPDGTSVNIEKGSFFTAEEASFARDDHMASLLHQENDGVSRLFEDVFNEFIEVHCKGKHSLRKKYISYYNSRIKHMMGHRKIGDTYSELRWLYKALTNGKVKDNRSKDNNIVLTQKYVAGLRAMLCNLYDYAYINKYISYHPMYSLPNKWGADDTSSLKMP